MAYFNEGRKKLTFTKSIKGVRDHALKFAVVILLTTLVLFSTASSLRPWFLVNVNCSRAAVNTTINQTEEVRVIGKKLFFGISTVCSINETDVTETCRHMASFDIAETIPLKETKSLLVLVIMLNAFGLLLVTSTCFCNPGFAKTAVTYIVLGCLGFAVLCSLFGLREATVNFDKDVRKSLYHFVDNDDYYIGQETCTVLNIELGFCYRMTVAAVVLLNVAIIFYLVHWRYPTEHEIVNQQQSNVERLHQLIQQRYRLMSHVSAHDAVPV